MPTGHKPSSDAQWLGRVRQRDWRQRGRLDAGRRHDVTKTGSLTTASGRWPVRPDALATGVMGEISRMTKFQRMTNSALLRKHPVPPYSSRSSIDPVLRRGCCYSCICNFVTLQKTERAEDSMSGDRPRRDRRWIGGAIGGIGFPENGMKSSLATCPSCPAAPGRRWACGPCRVAAALTSRTRSVVAVRAPGWRLIADDRTAWSPRPPAESSLSCVEPSMALLVLRGVEVGRLDLPALFHYWHL